MSFNSSLFNDGEHSLRGASVKEYSEFVMKHLGTYGGKIDFFLDGSFKDLNIKIATKSTTIPESSNAGATHVIVPEGIEIIHEGNSLNILDMRNGSMSMGAPSITSDVAEEMMESGWKFEDHHFGADFDKLVANNLVNCPTPARVIVLSSCER